MFRNLDGIRHLDKSPDALFIIDLKREHNAVAEARKLKIPIVAIVDTNINDMEKHRELADATFLISNFQKGE